MLHSLSKYLVIEWIAENQLIAAKINVYILCHCQIEPAAVVHFHIAHHHRLTMTHNHFYQHTLY